MTSDMALPLVSWRLAGRPRRGWQKREDMNKLPRDPAEYLRHFHYDTIGYADEVIDYLARVVGTDRVLMGSDYSFPIADEHPVATVTRNPSLDDAAKRAITATNARRLLRL